MSQSTSSLAAPKAAALAPRTIAHACATFGRSAVFMSMMPTSMCMPAMA